MVLGGVNFAVAKVGLEQLPPMLFMALRFALVAILLLPFAKRPECQWGAVFAIAVTLGLLHFSFMFPGPKTVDTGTASIAIPLQVPFARSEEHTSDLKSLMCTSYAVFCLQY